MASAAVAEEVVAEVIAQSATAFSWLASAQISQGHGSLGFIPSSSIYVYSPVSHSHQVWVYSLHGSRSCLRPLSENLRLWGGRCPSLLSSWCPGGVRRWCPGSVPVVSRWCPSGVPVVSLYVGGVPVSWCCPGVPVYFHLGVAQVSRMSQPRVSQWGGFVGVGVVGWRGGGVE